MVFSYFLSPRFYKIYLLYDTIRKVLVFKNAFGRKNAPSAFQRFVNRVFADMVKEDKVIIYLDDIMIATKGIEEHLDILGEVYR